jgi:hypothetical protein
LEAILDEKNEYIVRVKARGAGIDCGNNSSNYLNELVRVLTRKVADRDEIIRRMEMNK